MVKTERIYGLNGSGFREKNPGVFVQSGDSAKPARRQDRFITLRSGDRLNKQSRQTLLQITLRLDDGRDLNTYQETFLRRNPGLLEAFIEDLEHRQRRNGDYVNGKTRKNYKH